MTIEKLKDKLHDKIEIYVCEVEENTLIAQGMLKALVMMDEVLEKAEQEPFGPCDLCRFNPPSSADGKPCTMCPAEKGGE